MAERRKIHPNSFEAMTSDEKAAFLRAQLYQTHKARGSLGVFFQMYPDLAPPSRPRGGDGRERER